MNRERKLLVEFLEKRGWGILNGYTIGVEEGKFTFTGEKGESRQFKNRREDRL